MEQNDIIKLLRNEKGNLQEKFGLISIGLFGSHAKGTEGPESDVELLVELSEARFDVLAGLQIYLESRLEKPVELIRKRTHLIDILFCWVSMKVIKGRGWVPSRKP